MSAGVPISTIATFKRVQALTQKEEDIAKALQESDSVEVSKDGKSLRRVAPLPDKVGSALVVFHSHAHVFLFVRMTASIAQCT